MLGLNKGKYFLMKKLSCNESLLVFEHKNALKYEECFEKVISCLCILLLHDFHHPIVRV